MKIISAISIDKSKLKTDKIIERPRRPMGPAGPRGGAGGAGGPRGAGRDGGAGDEKSTSNQYDSLDQNLFHSPVNTPDDSSDNNNFSDSAQLQTNPNYNFPPNSVTDFAVKTDRLIERTMLSQQYNKINELYMKYSNIVFNLHDHGTECIYEQIRTIQKFQKMCEKHDESISTALIAMFIRRNNFLQNAYIKFVRKKVAGYDFSKIEYKECY